jgi:hypothetical protein
VARVQAHGDHAAGPSTTTLRGDDVGRSQQRAEEILAHFPQPVLLEEPRWWPRAMVIGGAIWAFALLCLAIFGTGDADPDFDGLVMALIYAPLGLVVVLYGTRDLRRPNKLVLHRRGFELTGARGEKSYDWSNAANFRVFDGSPDADSVVFDVLTPPRPRRKRDYFDHLTDNYGMSDDALAWLMERWRERASAESSPTPR